jgi:hypothetical protein
VKKYYTSLTHIELAKGKLFLERWITWKSGARGGEARSFPKIHTGARANSTRYSQVVRRICTCAFVRKKTKALNAETLRALKKEMVLVERVEQAIDGAIQIFVSAAQRVNLVN